MAESFGGDLSYMFFADRIGRRRPERERNYRCELFLKEDTSGAWYFDEEGSGRDRFDFVSKAAGAEFLIGLVATYTDAVNAVTLMQQQKERKVRLLRKRLQELGD